MPDKEKTTEIKRPGFPWITGGIVLALLAYVVYRLVGLYNAKPEENVQMSVERLASLSSEERTATYVSERMNDKEYMAALRQLSDGQANLAAARVAASEAFAKWRETWVASNAAARAVSEKMNAFIVDGGDLNSAEGLSLAAELNALIQADPEGAALVAKCAEAEKNVAEHQELIKSVIGGRIRKQTEEHAGVEAKIAREIREKYNREHPEAKVTSRMPDPSLTNYYATVEKRGDGWWTNAAAVKMPSPLIVSNDVSNAAESAGEKEPLKE